VPPPPPQLQEVAPCSLRSAVRSPQSAVELPASRSPPPASTPAVASRCLQSLPQSIPAARSVCPPLSPSSPPPPPPQFLASRFLQSLPTPAVYPAGGTLHVDQEPHVSQPRSAKWRSCGCSLSTAVRWRGGGSGWVVAGALGGRRWWWLWPARRCGLCALLFNK
jgi:hypothetical protein